jgi:hypothetical protein
VSTERGHPAEGPPADERPGRLLTRPWLWALIVAAGFAIPLIKSLQAELPAPLPGLDGPSLELELVDETGQSHRLSDLRGRLAIVTGLPLVNEVERDATFDGLRRLRKRLRGLDKTVVYVVLCQGRDPAPLIELLDERKARKPVNLFLMDPGGRQLERLREAAGSPAATFLLVDRHGRVRGVYGETQAELDRLVGQTGELANWAAQDPPPAS